MPQRVPDQLNVVSQPAAWIAGLLMLGLSADDLCTACQLETSDILGIRDGRRYATAPQHWRLDGLRRIVQQAALQWGYNPELIVRHLRQHNILQLVRDDRCEEARDLLRGISPPTQQKACV